MPKDFFDCDPLDEYDEYFYQMDYEDDGDEFTWEEEEE